MENTSKYQRISGYRNLILWQEAKTLTVLIYKLTHKFPRSEDFGLKSQMRRAAVSVMSQIAEGWARNQEEYIIFDKQRSKVSYLLQRYIEKIPISGL